MQNKLNTKKPNTITQDHSIHVFGKMSPKIPLRLDQDPRVNKKNINWAPVIDTDSTQASNRQPWKKRSGCLCPGGTEQGQSDKVVMSWWVTQLSEDTADAELGS